MDISRFKILNNPTFIKNHKEYAKEALSKFKYVGEELTNLKKIAEKGYFVKGNQLITLDRSYKFTASSAPKKAYKFFVI